MIERDTPVTDRMRRAFLHAVMDTKCDVVKEGAIARSYVGEKLDVCFAAKTEQDLMGRLDLQRREIYNRRLRDGR